MLAHVLVSALAARLVLANPVSSPPVVHEARTVLPGGWASLGLPSPSAPLNLRLGLAQSNMDRLDEFLMAVSHPESPSYGQHWTPAQVAQAFAPAPETVDAVRAWLKDMDVDPARVHLTVGNVWLELNATVAEAEKLLSTTYKVYAHESGIQKIGCEKYHLPKHVSKHVELVTPTVHFDAKVAKRGTKSRAVRPGAGLKIGQPGQGIAYPKSVGTLSKAAAADDLSTCDQNITPACLRALYDIEYTPVATDLNSYGIVEYTPQAYIKSDLDLFYNQFAPEVAGKYPILASIDGGYAQTEYQGFGYNGESDLDVEYAQAIIGQQNLTLYQVGDIVEGASFNDFLDALDASYCAGDDPNQDGIYPDPYDTEANGAYKGPKDCGTQKAAYVISTSYGYNEADLTPAYTARQCAEYAKLGLLGTTFVYSSGDSGVAGNGDLCLEADGSQSDTGTIFNPGFPAGCPYVTTIGATQLPAGKTVDDPESATYEVIYSGGGFSNYFPRPSYQEAAVDSYFASYTPSYSTTLYNGTGRGFPDISANGANYVVGVTGDFYLVFGTSASAPVIGAMLSNINDARLAAGKSPLGFINPALYSADFADVYNDITNGTNPGCGTEGFSAVPGWDPVTGLGTPKFPVLLERFLAL